MCDGALTAISGQQSKKQAAVAAERTKPVAAARVPDTPVDDGGAVVLEQPNSDILSTGTDVAVKRGKKTATKGVPGLGL